MQSGRVQAEGGDVSGIRVLVVDDHELTRRSIAAELVAAGGIEVIGSCADGVQALDAASLGHPDVVLMDLSMPRMDGVEATALLAARYPSTRVVIFTSAVDGRRVNAALAAGATSCVFKGSPVGDVIHAVRCAVD